MKGFKFLSHQENYPTVALIGILIPRTDTPFCHSLRAGQETVTDFTARRTGKLNNGARLLS